MTNIPELASAIMPTDDFLHMHAIDRVSRSVGAVEKARRYTADTDFLLSVIGQLLDRLKGLEQITADAQELARLRKMEREVRAAVGNDWSGPTG